MGRNIGASQTNGWDIGASQIQPSEAGIELSGEVPGIGQAEGSLIIASNLTGESTGIGQPTGSLEISANLTGSAPGLGQPTGALEISVNLTGSVNGLGQATASVEVQNTLSGEVIGIGQATGVLSVDQGITLSGVVPGLGQAFGSLEVITDIALSGTVNGIGQATGTITLDSEAIDGDLEIFFTNIIPCINFVGRTPYIEHENKIPYILFRSNDMTIEPRSLFGTEASFKDPNGLAVTPKTITYTLTDNKGNIVNNVEDEPVTPASSTVCVSVDGDSTDNLTNKTVQRKLTVTGIYDSVQFGNNRNIVQSVIFSVSAKT